MSDPNRLFKPIGEIATETNDLAEVADDDARLDDANPQFEQEEEDGVREVQQIESLCMECEEQGVTRMLLTSIPYFREVVVMSFRCEHCGNSNTEIQSAGEIQVKGSVHTVHILTQADLNRQLIKSPTATITIPEIALTIPEGKGQLTNVEGIVSDTVRDLSADQAVRKVIDPDTYTKIQALVDRLKECLDDEDEVGEDGRPIVGTDGAIKEGRYKRGEKPFTPFTIKLDDPAGNSFVQFLGSMAADTQWTMRAYNRTRAQNVTLGLVAQDEEQELKAHPSDAAATAANLAALASLDPSSAIPSTGIISRSSTGIIERTDGTIVPEEVYSFPGVCSSCGHSLETLMQKVNIPHFKDIIIMSTNCDRCGYRDNEVKSGGAIPELGKRIELRVEDEEDLSRDLLKSETCGLEIPEIDLYLHPGTLGGRFTTLEGLLNQVYEELSTKVFNDFSAGDSGKHEDDPEKKQFAKFLGDLKDVMSAARPFTLILDDPVANSYLQNLYAPDPDPAITITTYERTFEQNEDLGINDMVLEGYEEKEEEERKEREEAARKEAVAGGEDEDEPVGAAPSEETKL